jgi:hypothetical protein
MDLRDLKARLQRFLSDGLVVIVGSGLSCAEGMPGMSDIATYLTENIPKRISGTDLDVWNKIVPDISSLGLEGALLKTKPTAMLESEIMRAVAELLIPIESKIVAEAIAGKRVLPISRLFRHLLKPQDGIPVITTNYDRLIEFSAEAVGLGVDTMFFGNYCGALDEKESRLSFLRDVVLRGKIVRYTYRDRIRLFKPHGSFDWYQGPEGPLRHSGEVSMPRLIITPGLNKFRSGYDSPFDKHRDRANEAIDRASRFLILGFGFNDDHLETHLKPIVQNGKPALLITRQVSDAAKSLRGSCPNFISLEHANEGGVDGTRVVVDGVEVFIPNIKIWNLNDFVSEVLEP